MPPLNAEWRADEVRARMRAESPVRSRCGHAGGRPRGLDRWQQWRQRKEVSPRYVLEVKPVGPASGWDVGVRGREESGCWWGGHGEPWHRIPTPELPSWQRRWDWTWIFKSSGLGWLLRETPSPLYHKPLPWGCRTELVWRTRGQPLSWGRGGYPCSPLVAGSGEALSWKAVVAVPT